MIEEDNDVSENEPFFPHLSRVTPASGRFTDNAKTELPRFKSDIMQYKHQHWTYQETRGRYLGNETTTGRDSEGPQKFNKERAKQHQT